MSPLERLFRLEIEFQRAVRAAAAEPPEVEWLHTSFALQSGYELLIVELRNVSSRELDRLRERLLLLGDPRDILAARDSLRRLLGPRMANSNARGETVRPMHRRGEPAA